MELVGGECGRGWWNWGGGGGGKNEKKEIDKIRFP